MQYNAFLCALDNWAEKWRVIPKMYYGYQHIYYPHSGSSTPNPLIFFRFKKMHNTTGLFIWDEKKAMPKPNNTAISKWSMKRQVLAPLTTDRSEPALPAGSPGLSQKHQVKARFVTHCQWGGSYWPQCSQSPTLATPDAWLKRSNAPPPLHPSARKMGSSTCAAGLQHNPLTEKPWERGPHMLKQRQSGVLHWEVATAE